LDFTVERVRGQVDQASQERLIGGAFRHTLVPINKIVPRMRKADQRPIHVQRILVAPKPL